MKLSAQTKKSTDRLQAESPRKRGETRGKWGGLGAKSNRKRHAKETLSLSLPHCVPVAARRMIGSL